MNKYIALIVGKKEIPTLTETCFAKTSKGAASFLCIWRNYKPLRRKFMQRRDTFLFEKLGTFRELKVYSRPNFAAVREQRETKPVHKGSPTG